ncbi:MAG: glycosyltransferase [Vulcanimicrobiaceae bacterium]
MTKRVLFLISDTGGGHRAGAQAIGAALDEIDGSTRYEWRIDDIATHCTFPLSKLGPAYSAALRYAPPIYGALYHATNGRRRYRTLVRFCEPLYRERLREVFQQYQPDAIVSVHPLLNHAALRARADAGMTDVPIVTVVTDLGRVHEGWLLPEADLTVVPAPEVYARAIERGVPAERLKLIGHPIHPRFEDVSATKAEVRKKLGLPLDATVALLMAGGEGGGKLLPTTLGLAKAGLDFHLVVVTGRNAALKQKLEELAPTLATPMTVLGFRNDVPELMRAADLLVTKAGPGTIAEASVAEVPVVVYDYVPGQERGNLDYVRTNGIGVVALTTSQVVSSVARIVHNQERLAKMRAQQTAVAPRGSSRKIAELIGRIAIDGRRIIPAPAPATTKTAAAVV